MKILLIGGTADVATIQENDYYHRYATFFEEGAEGAASVDYTLFEDLIISVGDGELSVYDVRHDAPLSSYDAIFMLGAGFKKITDVLCAVSSYAHAHGIPVMNDYEVVRDASKLLQAVRFHELDIPVARTLDVNKALLEHFDKVGDWQFPSILKARRGAHGNDNYLVNTLDEVVRIVQDTPEQHYVLQRLVPNNGDYRILLVGEGVMVIGRTAVEGSHLNNTSQGGAAEEVPLDTFPPEVIDQSRRIARALDMTMAGVDVIQDNQTGQFYFLEVNSQPQLITGAFVDKKRGLIGDLIKSLPARNNA